MDALRLQNFRCIEDSGMIDIKPINFLVGSNSSGKSSFLKFFPLIKQSIGKRKKGVFLWNGGNVDFQNFSTTVKNGEKVIKISLLINDINWTRRLRVQKAITINSVGVEFNIKSEGNFDRLVLLNINLGEQFISCSFDEGRTVSIAVNNLSSHLLKDKIFYQDTSSLFPRFIYSNSGRIDEEYSYGCMTRLKEIAVRHSINSSVRNLYPLYSSVVLSKNELRKRIVKCWNITNISDDELNEIQSLITYYNINNILDSININILQFAENMIYVGPLREATDRYYRYQNLAVDEIEPDGSNLAMFLYNLREDMVEHLNEWIKELFRFNVRVEATVGHVQILIKENDKLERNLVDSGFGYTQVLPILVNIWKALYLDTNQPDSPEIKKDEHLIAIEQPELHLHPRFQSWFAEMLVKVINKCKEDKKDIRFVIETHSEMILNKIGEMIALNHFSRNDVQIIIFNAQNEDMEKYIERAEYTTDGFLTNWPIGFFAEYVD